MIVLLDGSWASPSSPSICFLLFASPGFWAVWVWVYWLILFWSVCVCGWLRVPPARAVHWLPPKSHLLPSLPGGRKIVQGDISLALDYCWVQNSWLSRECTVSSGSAAGNPPPCGEGFVRHQTTGADFWWWFVHRGAGSVLRYWPALQPPMGSCGAAHRQKSKEIISSFLWEKGWFQPQQEQKCEKYVKTLGERPIVLSLPLGLHLHCGEMNSSLT